MPERTPSLRVVLAPGLSIPVKEVDLDTTAQGLLSTLVAKIGLPSDTTGILIQKSTGQEIPPWQSLRAASIEDGETLIADFAQAVGSSRKWLNLSQKVLAESGYDVAFSDILRITIPLPPLLAFNEFFDNVADRIRAIEFIYSIFALLSSGPPEIVKGFTTLLKEQNGSRIISNPQFHYLLSAANIEPLRLFSVYYGSPASFDFLGIGKILEIVRDIIKDLAWCGKHEEQMAKLERQIKQAEIRKARMESEKIAIELATQRLEVEKATVEVATRKLELLTKVAGLKLSDANERLIVTTLMPEMRTIVSNPVIPLLKGETVTVIQSVREPLSVRETREHFKLGQT